MWLFVILISSISYVGYFLEKFLGEEKGLIYTSILGGLASTTAATLHFARNQKETQKERPEETFGLWRAFVIANSVQFPRALLIVALVSPDLAPVLALPMIVMTLCGRRARRKCCGAGRTNTPPRRPWRARQSLPA